MLPSVGSLGLNHLKLGKLLYKKKNFGARAKDVGAFPQGVWAMTHFTATTNIPLLGPAIFELYRCTTPSEADKGNPKICLKSSASLVQRESGDALVETEDASEAVMTAIETGASQVLPLIKTHGNLCLFIL